MDKYAPGSLMGDVYGVPQRRPHLSESAFFWRSPHVAGMAAEDNAVVMNPFSQLSDSEKQAVIMNEAARVFMRTHQRPSFPVTGEQQQQFGQYGSPQDIRETIAGRLLSGDPSAGQGTPEQLQFIQQLRTLMGIR
jgi:hypothetical protein